VNQTSKKGQNCYTAPVPVMYC